MIAITSLNEYSSWLSLFLEDTRECVVNSLVLLSRTCFISVRTNRIMKKLYIHKPIHLGSDAEASTSHQILGRDFEFSALFLSMNSSLPVKLGLPGPFQGPFYLLAAIVQQQWLFVYTLHPKNAQLKNNTSYPSIAHRV